MNRTAPPTIIDRVRRDPLVSTVQRRLRHRCGAAGPGAVVVGVSGGADSSALLLALAVLRRRGDEAALAPVAVHVHHHLRGESADADAACADDLARALGVPFHLEHVHPAARAGNVAANARALRYEALRRAAVAAGAAWVAVGHHGDDQLETMLIALGRGTGLAGLAGMAWSRPLGEGIRLIRPLLDCRAVDCAALCRRGGIQWRRDPTNDDPHTLRGRLRREVMPHLEAMWPEAARRAASTADLVAGARRALDARVAGFFGPPRRRAWPRGVLADLPPATIAAGLRRSALEAVPAAADDLGQRLLLGAAEMIRDGRRRPRTVQWPGGLVVGITARRVELTVTGAPE